MAEAIAKTALSRDPKYAPVLQFVSIAPAATVGR